MQNQADCHNLIHKPYIISVCHQKGGVGKTTTVSSLGASLAELNYQVLLVDLDPSANLTTGLGLSQNNNANSAADILIGNESLQNISQKTSLTGLNLIPSNSDMITAARFLYIRKNYEYILKDLFKREGHPFDIILIDCPPMIGSLTVCALTAAHLAIIPLQCEYYPLQALYYVIKTIKTIRERSNPLLIYQLLITMYDKRGKFHARLLEQIKEHFSDSMFNTIIGFDSKLRESQYFEVPILTHAKNTRAARQYRQLAKELLNIVDHKESSKFSLRISQ
jgi:chromosome partitioning protein